MAVIKKSASGKAVQFITDEGVVYQMATSLFPRVMSENITGDFIVLTRMPIPVPHNKFPKSPIYGDKGIQGAVNSTGANAFSKEFVQERKEQKEGAKASEYKVAW